MSDVQCPCCNKGVQARHTYMANLPATVVCTGCGSWFQIDVANSGGTALLGLALSTLVLAYFFPIMLVFLPVYFVMSMGQRQRFTVELVRKPCSEQWTISRDTGEIVCRDRETGTIISDTKLSEKFAGLRPPETNVFREKSRKYKELRSRMAQQKRAPLNPTGGPPQLSH